MDVDRLLTERQAAIDHGAYVEEENDRLRAEVERLDTMARDRDDVLTEVADHLRAALAVVDRYEDTLTRLAPTEPVESMDDSRPQSQQRAAEGPQWTQTPKKTSGPGS